MMMQIWWRLQSGYANDDIARGSPMQDRPFGTRGWCSSDGHIFSGVVEMFVRRTKWQCPFERTNFSKWGFPYFDLSQYFENVWTFISVDKGNLTKIWIEKETLQARYFGTRCCSIFRGVFNEHIGKVKDKHNSNCNTEDKIHEDNSKDVQLSEQERGAPWNQHALKFRLSWGDNFQIRLKIQAICFPLHFWFDCLFYFTNYVRIKNL